MVQNCSVYVKKAPGSSPRGTPGGWVGDLYREQSRLVLFYQKKIMILDFSANLAEHFENYGGDYCREAMSPLSVMYKHF